MSPRLAALILALVVTASARAQPIQSSGTQFVDAEGAPFRFVGANLGVMHGAPQRASLEAALDTVVAFGGRVVRVWALGEQPDDGAAWREAFAFQRGAGQPVESSFVHLDHVLAEARARDLRVIVVLANRWHDYGGLPRIARWSGQPAAGEELTPAELDRVWACDACAALVDAHARRVVTRTNSITGVRYVDDPTIFAWEIINESHAHSSEGADALVRWTEARAAHLRSLDADHMISAGHIGYRTSRGREVWRRVCALDAVSYCDAHAYPLRDPRIDSNAALRDYVDDRLAVARALGKPIVFGEVGFTQLEPRPRGRPAAAWLRRFTARAVRGGAAGLLWWIVKPTDRPDPFALDPGDRRQGVAIRASLAWGARRLGRASRARALRRFERTQSMFQWGPPLEGWLRRGREATLLVPVDRFRRARFERTGFHRDAPAHLHGSGAGEATWRVRSPALRGDTLRIGATLSSELPGLGGGGPRDRSRVEVLLDGFSLGEVEVAPDDGVGVRVEITSSDPALLRLLARPGTMRLQLRTQSVFGLAVYAAEPIELQLLRE